MQVKNILGALLISAGALALGSQAQAAPAAIGPDAAGGMSLIQVQREDCHQSVRRHYLPEYGRRVEHYHRGPRCRVVVVEEEEEDSYDDCHRDPQRHYVEEYGRRIWHRHVGPRCRVQELRESDRRGEGCVRVGPVTVCP